LPTVTSSDLIETIRLLQEYNIPTVAAAIGDNALSVWEKDLQGSIAVAFGSEGHGIRDSVLNECSGQVMVPMTKSVDSLNVGVAHGIILYEIMRQRQKRR
jgi:23S rRNA (guanosine2251-2'-O)-methyltransferase